MEKYCPGGQIFGGELEVWEAGPRTGNGPQDHETRFSEWIWNSDRRRFRSIESRMAQRFWLAAVSSRSGKKSQLLSSDVDRHARDDGRDDASGARAPRRAGLGPRYGGLRDIRFDSGGRRNQRTFGRLFFPKNGGAEGARTDHRES